MHVTIYILLTLSIGHHSLLYDLQRTRIVVDLISIEIGCLGHFIPETLAQVATACCVSKKTVRSLFEQAAHIAISCSYRIFNCIEFPRSGIYWTS